MISYASGRHLYSVNSEYSNISIKALFGDITWLPAQPLESPAWITRACSKTQKWQSISEETHCQWGTVLHTGSYGWRKSLCHPGRNSSREKATLTRAIHLFLVPHSYTQDRQLWKMRQWGNCFLRPYEPKVAILNVLKEIFHSSFSSHMYFILRSFLLTW